MSQIPAAEKTGLPIDPADKSTPRPWAISAVSDGIRWRIVSESAPLLVFPATAHSRLDAELIVTAVNAYPALLKCREALDGTDGDAPDYIRPIAWLRSAIEELTTRGPAEDCDDPAAYWDMVEELKRLESNGREALALLSPSQEKRGA